MRLRIKEAAIALGISVDTLRRWALANERERRREALGYARKPLDCPTFNLVRIGTGKTARIEIEMDQIQRIRRQMDTGLEEMPAEAPRTPTRRSKGEMAVIDRLRRRL